MSENVQVIEEAPSTFVDSTLRAAMGKQAVDLAKNVGYDSAGTVEFLVDKHKNFYFLEMNTRLQVEHPITEYITGIDLVHQMVRIAKGHPLKHAQKDVQIRGWAVESRVYAENPYKNFGLPSVGRLTRYQEPLHIPNVRCDSGVQEGSEISIYYDPMICKLITYGQTRDQALDTMKSALDNYVIRGMIHLFVNNRLFPFNNDALLYLGLTHNIPLLRDIITEPNFVEGKLNTNYLPSVYVDGFKGRQLTKESAHSLVAIASAMFLRYHARSKSFSNTSSSELSNSFKSISTDLIVDLSQNQNENIEEMILTNVTQDGNQYKIKVNDFQVQLPNNISLAAMTLDFNINGQTKTVQLISLDGDGRIQLQFEGTIVGGIIVCKGRV